MGEGKQEIVDESNLELLLENEVEKYNVIKMKKQKEAKSLYDVEFRRIRMIENFYEKDEKIETTKKKIEQEAVIL